jgi:hypothetical protein
MEWAAADWVTAADHWWPRVAGLRFTKRLSSITRSMVATVVVATSRSRRMASQSSLSASGPRSHSTRKISSSPSVGCVLGGRAIENSFLAKVCESVAAIRILTN